MQIVAGIVEPGLGPLDMAAHPRDHFPESRGMIHLHQMRHFVRGQIVQHVGRRENQAPRERQGTRRRAGTSAARLIADRQPLHLDAQLVGIELRGLVQVTANFALEKIMHAPLGVF